MKSQWIRLQLLRDTFPASIQFTQTVLQDIEVLAVGPDNTLQGLGTGLTPQTGAIIVFTRDAGTG